MTQNKPRNRNQLAFNRRKVRRGIYRHYKGKEYEVIGVAHHSETLEEVVVYRALYESEFGTNALWIRPKEMFLETVSVDGNTMPRFALIDPRD